MWISRLLRSRVIVSAYAKCRFRIPSACSTTPIQWLRLRPSPRWKKKLRLSPVQRLLSHRLGPSPNFQWNVARRKKKKLRRRNNFFYNENSPILVGEFFVFATETQRTLRKNYVSLRSVRCDRRVSYFPCQ